MASLVNPIEMLTQFVETDLFTVAISHNRYTLLNQEAQTFWDVVSNMERLHSMPRPMALVSLPKAPAPQRTIGSSGLAVLLA